MTPREIADIVADNILEELFWFPSKHKHRVIAEEVLKGFLCDRLDEPERLAKKYQKLVK
jgi:hypothetical protein